LTLSWLLIHLTVYEAGKLEECEHGLTLRLTQLSTHSISQLCFEKLPSKIPDAPSVLKSYPQKFQMRLLEHLSAIFGNKDYVNGEVKGSPTSFKIISFHALDTLYSGLL